MTECIVTSSVLIAVVAALRFLFRGKISRRVQYALWGIVLLRLLMPFPLVGSSLSVMNWANPAQSTAVGSETGSSVDLPSISLTLPVTVKFPSSSTARVGLTTRVRLG